MTDQTVVPEAPAPAVPATPAPKSRAEIARELYGNEFYGKTEEAKPVVEEPKPADTQASEEAPVEEPTEGGEPEEGGEGTAPAESGETPIASLSELVEHYELDPEWAQTLKVPVTVDGTPTEATIGDLIKSYQIGSAAENRLEDAKAVARKESEAWAAKHAAYDRQMNELAALVQYEEQKLENDIKAIDPKLREEDPAEWSARITEFGQRRSGIANIKAQAVASWQSNNEVRQAEARTITDQFKAEQAQLLLHQLPEWQDRDKANTEKAQIAQYAINSGYSPQELDNLLDHRYVLTLRKAMLYDQSRGQVDAAKKRVAKVPKVMKPGAPKAKEQIASERLAALAKAKNRSGSDADALAYILAKRGISR